MWVSSTVVPAPAFFTRLSVHELSRYWTSGEMWLSQDGSGQASVTFRVFVIPNMEGLGGLPISFSRRGPHRQLYCHTSYDQSEHLVSPLTFHPLRWPCYPHPSCSGIWVPQLCPCHPGLSHPAQTTEPIATSFQNQNLSLKRRPTLAPSLCLSAKRLLSPLGRSWLEDGDQLL